MSSQPSQPTPVSTTMPSPQYFGKYQLVERLGRGGMAEVWKARVTGPAGFSRTMVLKRILPHLIEDPHFTEMFVAEARLSAKLNHANIVQVYELGDVNGEYYLAMEYVHGRDLVSVMRALLARGAPPPPGLGAFAMREVCRALHYAHSLTDDHGQQLRLIHRDVSPSNVMVSFDGAVKLLDFGIAKALADANESKTQTGTLKGKFGYMSPEQVEGREIDHRADLFAAGIVLHESLTGRRLFKGSGDLQTIAMVREAKVPPPSQTNPSVPPELDRIVMRALARSPNERYQTCEEMAYALDSVVHQLMWGPERAKSALADLFPDEPSQTDSKLFHFQATGGLTIGTLRKHERRKLVAWIAAGAVMVGGLAWLITARARHRPVMPPAKAPVVAQAPVVEKALPEPPPVVAPPPPALPATVRLRVQSTPAGAEAVLAPSGDAPELRDKTPFVAQVPRSSDLRKLTLRYKGYKPVTVDVQPDADSSVQLALVAEPPPRPAPRPARKVEKKSAPARPAADLRRGDVVDPFAR
jgi:serine/threonine protein kinase